MKIIKLRIITVFLFVFLEFIIISFRLFQVQIVNNNFFLKKVSAQSKMVKKHQDLRGNIFDRNMRLLATSINVETCYLETRKAKGKIDVKLFSKCINIPTNEIISKINQDKNVVLIKRKLLPNEVLNIKSKNFPGIFFQREQLRYYPENSMANHVIGFVGTDNTGLSGVEHLFNDFLTGKSKKYTITKDGKGREIVFNDSVKLDEEVRSVKLTIDGRIQHIVERELKKAYTSNSPRNITSIIQNPMTGEILAMASYPSFNPNEKIDVKMLKNPSISDAYEPGSVFKIVPAAAALEKYPNIFNEKFFCENGSYKLAKNITIKDHEKYGVLSFEQMLAYSSNIGFAKLADRIGKNDLWQFARAFGFGMSTGIELTGEINGKLMPPSKWSGISCEVISFGQEIFSTSIQLVNAFSVIANGGILMEPKIIKSIMYNNEEKQIFEPIKLRRVISVKTAQTVKNMLESVVDYGTGTQAKIEGIKVAGKTGTAQKFDIEMKKYSNSKYVSLFAGFLPADNPRITILIVVDEPKGDYWASSVAAPIFKRIALGVLEYMNIGPAPQIAMVTNAENTTLLKAGKEVKTVRQFNH